MNRNSLALAYLGDCIYELYIRNFLVRKCDYKVKELQEMSIKYVSAKGQSSYLRSLIDNDYLTLNELDIVKCARNHKNNHKPKNSDIITYKNATGLEALIGYLYLNKQEKRIEEIMNYIIGR